METKLEFSTDVKFHPFVGESYWNENPRVLLLGESHYGDASANECCTKNVVDDFIEDPKKHRRFFAGMLRALYGADQDAKFAEHLNRLSFYNYVQETVGKTRASRPTRPMWTRAHVPFWDMLAVLKPDIILCFGKETYKNLPICGEEGDKSRPESWKYICRGVPTIVYNLEHPSNKGFNAAKYHNLLRTIPELDGYTKAREETPGKSMV